MFNEILVIHMHNSQLVYNFYEQAINFFFKFYMFYEIFDVITFNDRKLIGVLFGFVNRSC